MTTKVGLKMKFTGVPIIAKLLSKPITIAYYVVLVNSLIEYLGASQVAVFRFNFFDNDLLDLICYALLSLRIHVNKLAL